MFAAFNTLHVFNLLEIVYLILIWHRMNHSVKRRRQTLHQTHHHYYLNISVGLQAANFTDWRIKSNRKKIDSVARIESKFFSRIGMLYLMRYVLKSGNSLNSVFNSRILYDRHAANIHTLLLLVFHHPSLFHSRLKASFSANRLQSSFPSGRDVARILSLGGLKPMASASL